MLSNLCFLRCFADSDGYQRDASHDDNHSGYLPGVRSFGKTHHCAADHDGITHADHNGVGGAEGEFSKGECVSGQV